MDISQQDEDGPTVFSSIKNKIKKHRQIIKSLAAPKRQTNTKWAMVIVGVALLASFFLSFISNRALAEVTLGGAFIILFLFILIGILFDVVGTSVTAASSTPFHSMAAKKVRGAKYALKIISAASKVSNFCNDVIGDITGIVSGGAVVVIVGYFVSTFAWASNQVLLNLILTSIVAALTIGGKALGKGIALNYSNTIIYYVGFVIESVIALVAPKKLTKQGEKKNKK